MIRIVSFVLCFHCVLALARPVKQHTDKSLQFKFELPKERQQRSLANEITPVGDEGKPQRKPSKDSQDKDPSGGVKFWKF